MDPAADLARLCSRLADVVSWAKESLATEPNNALHITETVLDHIDVMSRVYARHASR